MIVEGGDDVPPRQQFHEAKTRDCGRGAEIAVMVLAQWLRTRGNLAELC
jgi:hypothetical protein